MRAHLFNSRDRIRRGSNAYIQQPEGGDASSLV